MKIFLQMVLVVNGIFVSHRKQARGLAIYLHLQNNGKIFAFSPKQAWNWLSTEIFVLSKRGKGNTSEVPFFLKNIHRNELFHLNSH